MAMAVFVGIAQTDQSLTSPRHVCLASANCCRDAQHATMETALSLLLCISQLLGSDNLMLTDEEHILNNMNKMNSTMETTYFQCNTQGPQMNLQ